MGVASFSDLFLSLPDSFITLSNWGGGGGGKGGRERRGSGEKGEGGEGREEVMRGGRR